VLETLAVDSAQRCAWHVLVADLSDRDAVPRVVDRVAEPGLTVDLLVNNAGVSTMGTVAKSIRGREDLIGSGRGRGSRSVQLGSCPPWSSGAAPPSLKSTYTVRFQPTGQGVRARPRLRSAPSSESMSGELEAPVAGVCAVPGPCPDRVR